MSTTPLQQIEQNICYKFILFSYSMALCTPAYNYIMNKNGTNVKVINE